MQLESISEIKSRMDDLERKEQEESECEWAQCDRCNKWRRLGNGQVVKEDAKFFCQNVAKTCDDSEDGWDAEKEEITRIDEDADVSDADDDVSLADRKLMVPDALVYAQHEYYPFWPAQIRDPDAEYITSEILKVRRHGSLLVQFLGKSMGSGLKWIDRRKLLPFTPDADPNNKPGMRPIRSQDYTTAVQAARGIVNMQKKEAVKRERKSGDGESSSNSSDVERSDESSSDYHDSSPEEIDYGQAYVARGDRTGGGAKRQRKESTAAKAAGSTSTRGKSQSTDAIKSKRMQVRQEKKRQRSPSHTNMPSTGAVQFEKDSHSHIPSTGGVKFEKDSKRVKTDTQPTRRDPAVIAAALRASVPLFPKWFTQLPIVWQGSYSNYTAIFDAEQKLKERLANVTAPEVIRRDVRSMVFLSFISAMALELPATTPNASAPATNTPAANGPTANAPTASKSAQDIEDALFTSCGNTITADYRRRYRVLAMSLRACHTVRAAISGGSLKPAIFVCMSALTLDAYAKPSSNIQKKAPAPLPVAGGGGGGSAATKSRVVKEEGSGGAGAKAPLPERVIKVAPLKVPNFLPVVTSAKVERRSRSPSPLREAGRVGGESTGERERMQVESPQPQNAGGGGDAEVERAKQRELGLEAALVGEVNWIGAICKTESNTQVRVYGVCV